MKWFAAHVDEIARSAALRRYGVALSVTHVLTLLFWRGGASLHQYVADPVVICWPFWPACAGWRPWWDSVLTPTLVLFAATSLASVIAWGAGRVRAGYWLLLVATALKFLLYSIDYREMGNYHYMPAIVLLLFLFAPAKIEVMRFVIVGFYLGAGALKFNREWLSGAAIFGQPWLGGRWLALGCAAVLGLEMVGSLGLLARSRRVFVPTLAAFAVFHLFSWHIVGFFYPLVMFALLAIFPLARGPDAAGPAEFFAAKLARSTYVILAIFALMQLPPLFARTDSALTGEGRLTALNMFDARILCHAHVLVRREVDGIPAWIDVNEPLPGLGTRIHCEPRVYEAYARSLCATRDPALRAIRLHLLARRSSDEMYRVTLDRTLECGR